MGNSHSSRNEGVHGMRVDSPVLIHRWESKSLLLNENHSFDDIQNDATYHVALHDFNKQGEGQLSLRRGERVLVLKRNSNQEWCEVRSKSGVVGWVPSNYIKPIGSLEKYSWFHGKISRYTAEYLLSSGMDGSFLIRDSETVHGQLSISLRLSGRIYHYRINKDENGKWFVNSDNRFSSLPLLVLHHSSNADGLVSPLLYPAPKLNKPPIFTFGPSSDDDHWELERNEFILRNRLGGGQYGDVYEAFWIRYNRVVAIKTLKEETMCLDDFLAEAAIMKEMKHPNLVQLLGICTKEPPYFIISEYMSNGNLLDYLKCNERSSLTPTLLMYMAIQIAAAMCYLESRSYIHRDLAARNCLVKEHNVVKVADFGLARLVKDNHYTAKFGAKFPIKWTAPEGLAYNQFSNKSDVWSFGVLLWEIVSYGASPYPGVELPDVYHFLSKGYRMECPEGCPKAVYKLMQKCWRWVPDERPSFIEIYREIEDLFTTGSGNQVDQTDSWKTFESRSMNINHHCKNNYSKHFSGESKASKFFSFFCKEREHVAKGSHAPVPPERTCSFSCGIQTLKRSNEISEETQSVKSFVCLKNESPNQVSILSTFSTSESSPIEICYNCLQSKSLNLCQLESLNEGLCRRETANVKDDSNLPELNEDLQLLVQRFRNIQKGRTKELFSFVSAVREFYSKCVQFSVQKLSPQQRFRFREQLEQMLQLAENLKTLRVESTSSTNSLNKRFGDIKCVFEKILSDELLSKNKV